MKQKVFVVLFFIILLAGFLRFFDISNVPVSLYWDETASIYNAYSIEKTGKDEYGTPFPLLFRSFNDYKTPANIYLTAISVKIFGLNEFSARFSSALLGTLSVLLSFFLILEIFRNDRFIKKLSVPLENFALLVTFLFAISPWHIGFSRTGFEANSGLFFLLLGVYLFLRFLSFQKFKFFYSSLIIFAISIYFYRSIFIIAPLFLVYLFLSNYKFLLSNYKKALLGTLLFLALAVPFVPVMLSKNGMVRQNQVSIVNNSFDAVWESAKLQNQFGNTVVAKAIFNRRFVYAGKFALGYASHFIPTFWLFNGDGNLRHTVVHMGMIYLWEFPFLILGLFILFKLDKKNRNLLLFWILVTPVPAALSVPAPHALRTLNMLPMPQVVTSLGLLSTFYLLKGKFRKMFVSIIAVLIPIFFGFYIYYYYNVSAKKSSSEWADGYKELAQYVIPKEKEYGKIIISGHYWQPYIYFLFYKNYDPTTFQKYGSKKGFDNYFFGGTLWDKGEELGKVNLKKIADGGSALVALSPQEYRYQKNNIKILTNIYNHNNELVFIVGTLNEK